MIKTVTVTNYLGDKMVLDLFNPKRSGFAVKGITGLGPVKATVNTTEVPTDDGSLYNSARLNERNIVISLGFDWIPLIEDARERLWRIIILRKLIRCSSCWLRNRFGFSILILVIVTVTNRRTKSKVSPSAKQRIYLASRC